MSIIRNNQVWENFANHFEVDWFYGGEVTLSRGTHVVMIKLKQPINNCWIDIDEEEGISTVASKVYNDRVEIRAIINSEVASLTYFFDF